MLDARDRAASARSGIMAIYAARIGGAYRSGLPRGQIAGLVAALRRERDGALRAVMDQAASLPRGASVVGAAARRDQRQWTWRAGTAHQVHAPLRDNPRPEARAAVVKSFKAAARAMAMPPPAAPKVRKRRGDGSGAAEFRAAALVLQFRPAHLPSAAYGLAAAYLSDTLHWFELWQGDIVDSHESIDENNTQNSMSLSL